MSEVPIRTAVIDLGTVTSRMLVADVEGGQVTEVERMQAITQLGAGWTDTGALSADGIERVAGVVRTFVARARELGAAEVFAVATSAARDATNSEAFLDAVEAAGVRPDVIPGEVEAFLTFLGATYGRPGERIMVVDIGGGSTEITVGSAVLEDGERTVSLEATRSIDVGSRRVTELFLLSDPPTPREIDEAAEWLTAELRPFFSTVRERPEEMVAVAGTATSLAAIEMALDPYDPERVHGYSLSGAAVSDILEQLCSLTLEERRHVTGLEPDRAGVIIGGVLILKIIMALAGVASTLVSEHDILYGMALDARA